MVRIAEWRLSVPGVRRGETVEGRRGGVFDRCGTGRAVRAYQQVALIIDDDKLDRLGGDRFMRIINTVNQRLTTDQMIAMNRAVDLDKTDVSTVTARSFDRTGCCAPSKRGTAA